MRKTTVFCDECGKEVESPEATYPQNVEIAMAGKPYDFVMKASNPKGGQIDLCWSCAIKGAQQALQQIEGRLNPSVGTVEVSIPDQYAGTRTTGLEVPVELVNHGDVRAIQLVMRYDAEALAVTNVTPAQRLIDAGFDTVMSNILDHGEFDKELRVVGIDFGGDVLPEGAGPVLNLTVDVLAVPARMDFVTGGTDRTKVLASAVSEYCLRVQHGRIRAPRGEIDAFDEETV